MPVGSFAPGATYGVRISARPFITAAETLVNIDNRVYLAVTHTKNNTLWVHPCQGVFVKFWGRGLKIFYTDEQNEGNQRAGINQVRPEGRFFTC